MAVEPRDPAPAPSTPGTRRAPATPAPAAARPIRDNPRLILPASCCWSPPSAALLALASRSTQLLARLSHRGRPLRAVGRRPDDAGGAGLRSGAQHRQAAGRAAARAAVRAIPREAGGGAAGDDADPGGARADRRQRGDPQQRRPLVQRADGRDAVVGQSDRERLLPGAPEAGERSRGRIARRWRRSICTERVDLRPSATSSRRK